MANVFIVHGAEGNPDENWFPWLKNELQLLGRKVFVPTFPTPENQNLKSWLEVWGTYGRYFSEDMIVVGHSLGVLVLLNVLQKQRVKAAFLVSGFAGLPGNRFDDGMRSFVKDFDFALIRKNCPSFTVFHSDNDPYVDLSVAEVLASKLKASVSLVKNAGHFNSAAGYDKFPDLLEDLGESFDA